MDTPSAATAKPSPEQRVMAELEAQRNSAHTQIALMGAELAATRDKLADCEAELAEEKLKVAQRRAK